MNVRRKVLHKYRQSSWTINCWSFRFGVGTSGTRETSEWKGTRRGRGFGTVEGGSKPRTSSGLWGDLGWPRL